MIDIKLILEQPEMVAQNNHKRSVDLDIAKVESLSSSRKELIEKVEKLREQANEVAASIPKASEEERKELVEKGRALKEEVKGLEAELTKVESELDSQLRQYPNILQEDVPEGKDETSNEVLREVGEKPEFTFQPKDHLDLGEQLGMIDMERAAKVSGARFTYLKGDLVLLQFALMNYVLQTLSKEGFLPTVVPHIVNTSSMAAMGYLEHGGEEEVYHLKNDDAVLIGTSEQAMGPMHMNEILKEETLPLRYVAYSPCYRREAGSYGKDMRGILRLHQFDKLEMFSFTTPETSNDEHELLLSLQEKLMQGLGLPYRAVKLCSGDTGTPSSRTYDIETWMPSQNCYRETHSTSNTTDFQTRRLNTRIKRKGKNVHAHALNGTAFAIGRILIALMENGQQEDGSIKIPEALQQWMHKDTIN
jgi:seryl-tRNA synthetase